MLQQEAIWHNVCWQAFTFTVHGLFMFRQTFCSVASSLHLYLHVEQPIYISQYVHPKNTIAFMLFQLDTV